MFRLVAINNFNYLSMYERRFRCFTHWQDLFKPRLKWVLLRVSCIVGDIEEFILLDFLLLSTRTRLIYDHLDFSVCIGAFGLRISYGLHTTLSFSLGDVGRIGIIICEWTEVKVSNKAWCMWLTLLLLFCEWFLSVSVEFFH
jgi:hypothetical protein